MAFKEIVQLQWKMYRIDDFRWKYIGTEDRLRQYFEQDEEQRFQLEGIISGGFYGITWKLKYRASPATDATYTLSTPSSQSEFQRIVLKIPSDPERQIYKGEVGALSEDARQQFINEKDMLAVVRWARHMVHGVEIRNDPLTALFQSNPLYQGDIHWFYTEWIENGTLGRFVTRVSERYLRLPNRLLWRFFMCLVRMVVAMGWPPRQPNEENPQPVIEEPDGPPYAAFAHGDLFVDRSIGNIMVGELAPNDPNSEHALTPMLHLIDLGEMGEQENIQAAVANNIHIIGCVMIELIALDHTKGQIAYNRTETHSSVRVNGKGPFPTFGEDLLRQDDYGGLVYPWLDRRMRALVSECLAQDPDMRSDPRALLEDIKSMVRDRNGEYYANQPAHDNIEESDEAIRRILDTVLNNA